MKTVFILMDSLNRHYLNAYEPSWVQTPNIDRLAKKGVVFDNHYAGSLPCMPARREIMTGRLNFLESRWCPLQPFDEAYPKVLSQQSGTYCHMITDHYHYFEAPGFGYHTPFRTWEFIRGQEGDHWQPRVKDPEIPVYRGKNRRQDWINRSCMNLERDEDYPTTQCFMRGINFLQNNHDQDNWLLHLEVFDPHEPFVCPQKYRDLYADTWSGAYHFDWPNYAPVDPEHEGPDAIEHIRKSYAGTLTMADVWLGKLLDKMDELDLWKDTTVILTTDHGHLLGDYGYWAKNYMFDYRKLAHIPLIAYRPGSPMNGKRVEALTSTVDLMPTLLELHGAVPSGHVQGKSLAHLLQKDGKHHDAVLYGYFAKDITLTDGRCTYTRQPVRDSVAYHHTATPVVSDPARTGYEHAELGTFLPQTSMPVYRVAEASRRHHNAPEHHLLYDIEQDPEQTSAIRNPALEDQYASKLRQLLMQYQAPEWQFARMGLR
ncbi:sulfatase [Paenibacillus doosanensis]|uniref:sulfatase n=1 Tax=Paenibacillus doosanensis TaxID=1229154 RepID=UPI00217F338A|nr:sulfatase [Paenibacillus doosanensis]MCS7461317.1 sulfatase [Paenibacillus doosanensis]